MTVKEYNNAVELYADSVYRFIRGNLRDDDRANDVVQDSFEKLWMHVTEIEYPVVKSWLFSTAYHNMIDILRREKKIVLSGDEYENEPVHSNNYSDLAEILREALDRLPEQLKTAVMLRDYEGYSYLRTVRVTAAIHQGLKLKLRLTANLSF